MAFSGGGTVVRPIDGFDLDIGDGELVLLLGASGCGKTTLLSALAALLRPAAGTIHLDDIEVTALQGKALTDYRSRRVGVVFQSFNLVPSLTALENVAVPMWNVGMGTRRVARRRADGLLDGSGSAIGACAIVPPTCPVASSSASPSPAPSPSTRRWCSPTSPPLISTTSQVDERAAADSGRRRVPAVSPSSRPTTNACCRSPTASWSCPERARRAVVAADQLELAPGELVFAEGDPGELVYVVEQGEIELVQQREDVGEEVIGQGRARSVLR